MPGYLSALGGEQYPEDKPVTKEQVAAVVERLGEPSNHSNLTLVVILLTMWPFWVVGWIWGSSRYAFKCGYLRATQFMES